MFRRLTTLLFEEEEVNLEEEEHVLEEVTISSVPVLKAPEAVPPKVDTMELKTVEDLASKEKNVDQEPSEKSKGFHRIDIEEKKEPSRVSKPHHFEREKMEYKRRNILSPMHGGSEKELAKEPISVPSKSSKTLTKIISPIYGNIELDESHAETLSEKMMDIDLRKMIDDEESDAEIQTSLYDFLEGLDKDE